MASITASHLTHGSKTTESSYTTASISPSVGDFVIVGVVQSTTSGNVPTATQAGITFRLIRNYQSASRSASYITLLGGISNGTAGAITIDFASQAQGASWYTVDKFQNTDSSPIVQSGVSDNNAVQTGLTINLTTLQNTNNATYGYVLWGGASTITVQNSFTQLFEDTLVAHESDWKLNNPQSAWVWSSGNNWSIAMAVEISVPRGGAFLFNMT